MGHMYEDVEGVRVPVRLYEGGRWVPVDELSALEQVARNQYVRRQRRMRAAWARTQAAQEVDYADDK